MDNEVSLHIAATEIVSGVENNHFIDWVQFAALIVFVIFDQEGAFALCFKSDRFPGEIVIARWVGSLITGTFIV